MKKILLALSMPYLLSAHTLPELFSALKSHAQTKSDEMSVEKAAIGVSQAKSELYPKVNLFASYDNYSDPTGMLPVAPNRLSSMLRKKDEISQPFSYNVYKTGLNFSMPIFVKSIYTMADEAKAMQRSAKARKRINMLKNEAIIVGSNANLLYLSQLKKALDLKEKSLLETKKILKIKVDNGRAPASALYKINDGLNQISISKNNIELQKKKAVSVIETLTGIKLSDGIAMQELSPVNKGAFKSLQPLQEKIKASELNVHAQKEKLYPSVVAHGMYSYSTATAYNTKNNINEHYGEIGVYVNIPLLAMSQYDAITKSKIELDSQRVELQKLNDELTSKADMLNASLPLLDRSIKLSKQSIKNKQKILKIAKVNYRSGRLTTEDYLQYENEVVDAKAKLYQAKAEKWQSVMQLAVIYANNIEEMVR